MATLGASLVSVVPGEVVIELGHREVLVQQNGFLHAGVTTAVMDSACGYAALTMMSPDADVLSVEFKVNLLAPAVGSSFRAVGRVVKSGRTLTVCQGEMVALDSGKTVALMTATMMAVRK
ncbi:MAG: PaaI family thioesterase [Candidatus Eremiobacteraeota bacterium]|nr:PaaI family thioesterase [Candidatus Eremiobacteraeota bacterium]MCW5872905.1 PaaI family thioesterase [Candidatus Eremiobacteraeota bacterium]